MVQKDLLLRLFGKFLGVFHVFGLQPEPIEFRRVPFLLFPVAEAGKKIKGKDDAESVNKKIGDVHEDSISKTNNQDTRNNNQS